jgi:hypothetical protein
MTSLSKVPYAQTWLTYLLAALIIQRHPDYSLFNDNCQNFARYLVKSICQNSMCPAPFNHYVSNVLSRLLAPSYAKVVRLPGTYPESILSDDSRTETKTIESCHTADTHGPNILAGDSGET